MKRSGIESRSSRRGWRAWAGGALLMGSAAVAVAAEQVVVRRPTLDIRDAKGSLSNVVATAKDKDTLDVVAREGPWLRVRLGGKEGYVMESALAARGSTGGNPALSALTGGPDTSGMSAAAAGKGLEPGAIDYANAKNLNQAPLNHMIDVRTRMLKSGAWPKFTREGNVGPDKPR